MTLTVSKWLWLVCWLVVRNALGAFLVEVTHSTELDEVLVDDKWHDLESPFVLAGSALSTSAQRRLQAGGDDVSDPYYYQTLRRVGAEVEEGNSLYRVSVPNASSSTRESYLLGELKAFIPFTVAGRNGPGPGMQADSFAALLAVYHFNNVEASPILNASVVERMCPDLRFTLSLLDSQQYPIEATRLFIQMIKSASSLAKPRATGIIGGYRSSVSLPLAILTGVNGIPQVSPASTANDFDDKDQYPLFGRTVWNAFGEAIVAVEFFQGIQSTHVVVLYITDTYGSSLQKAFQDAATRANITTAQVAMSSNVQDDPAELRNAIKAAKASQIRHIYAIFFDQQLSAVLQEAANQSLVGDDYFWLFPSITADTLTTNPLDPAVARAMSGSGLVNGVGGVEDTTEVVKYSSKDPASSPAFGAWDRFYTSWRVAHDDPSFVQYVLDSIPASAKNSSWYNSSSLLSDVGSWSLFLYDAVTALLLAMCSASNSTQFFSGDQAMRRFRETEFYGASGHLKFDHDTGTRDYRTVRWAVWNARYSNRNASLSLVPSYHYHEEDSGWVLEAPFLFANGGTVAPKSLRVENSYLGTTGRAVGYTFMCITLFSCVLSFLWLFYYRHSYVVVSSQPLFLLMISIGTFVMALTILPMGFEETVINSESALSSACMAVPWLYISGASLPLGAVLAKIRGVHKAYVCPEIECIHVTDLDLAVSFGGIFLVNVIILICWTTISPLQWERDSTLAVDGDGPLITTTAQCGSDDQVVYWTLLAVFNLGVLVLCNWWAYRSRNIETEFNESSYVGVSSAAVLQAWAMGIPIIVVVAADSPQAAFYVTTGIVFVTSQALISLVYIPKVIALRKARKEEIEKEKLEPFRAHKNSGSRGGDDNDPDDDGERVRDPTAVSSVVSAPARFVLTGSTQPLSSEEVTQTHSHDFVLGANARGSPDASPKAGAGSTSQEDELQFTKSDSHANGDRADNTRSGVAHAVSWSPGVFERQQQQQQQALPPAALVDSSKQQSRDTAKTSSVRLAPQRRLDSGKSFTLSSWRRLSVFSGGSGSSSSQTLGVSASGSGPFGGGGTKVLHNPRSKRALEATGGCEMSRRQLEIYVQQEVDDDADDDDNNLDGGSPAAPVQVATIIAGQMAREEEEDPSYGENGASAPAATVAEDDDHNGDVAARKPPPVMELADDDEAEGDGADTDGRSENGERDRSNGHKRGDAAV